MKLYFIHAPQWSNNELKGEDSSDAELIISLWPTGGIDQVASEWGEETTSAMNHTVVAGYVSGGDRCSVLKFTCGAVAQDKKTYDITAHVLKKKTVPTIVVNTINLGILLIQSRVIGGSELSIVKMHEVWIEKSHHLIEKTREGKIEYIVVALQNVTDRQQDSDAASTAACRTSILKIADGEVMVYGMLRRGESKVVDIAGVCTVHI